jgi:hypothetical protein
MTNPNLPDKLPNFVLFNTTDGKRQEKLECRKNSDTPL